MATLPEVDENEEITSYTEHIPAPPPTPKPKGEYLISFDKNSIMQRDVACVTAEL